MAKVITKAVAAADESRSFGTCPVPRVTNQFATFLGATNVSFY